MPSILWKWISDFQNRESTSNILNLSALSKSGHIPPWLLISTSGFLCFAGKIYLRRMPYIQTPRLVHHLVHHSRPFQSKYSRKWLSASTSTNWWSFKFAAYLFHLFYLPLSLSLLSSYLILLLLPTFLIYSPFPNLPRVALFILNFTYFDLDFS